MTLDTYEQGRKLLAATQRQRLRVMLQNMSRRFPETTLQRFTGGDFGVSLADGRFLRILTSGDWSDEELRDFFALFALWCVVDREGLTKAGRLAGASRMAKLESD